MQIGAGQNISNQQQHLSDPFRKGLQLEKKLGAKNGITEQFTEERPYAFLAFPKPNRVGYELSFLDLIISIFLLVEIANGRPNGRPW